MFEYKQIYNQIVPGSNETLDMPPQISPSWPSFGQVQKLTNLFEEKALPKKLPKKKPVPMPKLKNELLTKIKTALGEKEPTPKKGPKPSRPPKPSKPKPKRTNTNPNHEAQSGDHVFNIGDGRNKVELNQGPGNGLIRVTRTQSLLNFPDYTLNETEL